MADVARKPTLPLLQYVVVPHLLLALTATIRPNLFWRLVSFGFIAYALVFTTQFTQGKALFDDYLLGGFAAGTFFNAIHMLFSCNPTSDYHYRTDDFASATQVPFLQRYYWVLRAQYDLRGIGWNYQTPYIPPVPKGSSWAFVRNRSLRLLKYYVSLDLCQSYIRLNPLFSATGHGFVSITAQGYPYTCANIIAWAGAFYCMTSIQYHALALICVTSGFFAPEEWPDLFGAWSDSFTVRRFWGRTWHQNLRRFVTSIGKSICRLAGLTPGSTASSYTQLYSAFVISAIIHSWGDAVVSQNTEYIGCSAAFFLAQAVAITFEDVIVGTARMGGLEKPTLITKVIGYIWVFIWFSISTPLFISWTVGAGVQMAELLPVSPTRMTLQALNETYHVDLIPRFPSFD